MGLLEEVGFTVKFHLHCDSSAALGLMQKPGVSRPLRHLEVRFLFLQELLYEGKIKASKVPGTENMSDLMTKFATVAMLSSYLKEFRVVFVPLKEALRTEAIVVKTVEASA